MFSLELKCVKATCQQPRSCILLVFILFIIMLSPLWAEKEETPNKKKNKNVLDDDRNKSRSPSLQRKHTVGITRSSYTFFFMWVITLDLAHLLN